LQPGGGGHEQVAAVPQAEGGAVAAHREKLRAGAQELEAEAGHGDVERGGELLADRAGGQRGRGDAIGRVALDHGDRAVEGGMARQVIGDRAADRAAADDDDLLHGFSYVAMRPVASATRGCAGVLWSGRACPAIRPATTTEGADHDQDRYRPGAGLSATA